MDHNGRAAPRIFAMTQRLHAVISRFWVIHLQVRREYSHTFAGSRVECLKEISTVIQKFERLF